MRREVPYRTVLPGNYDNSQKRFPVLYLLHGLFGSCDNWLDLTGLKDYALDKELIIILPEGGDSWYTNSATIRDEKVESCFILELLPEVDLLYRTNKKRAIVGLSMGGYGALKFCFKRPDLFVFAGSISGALDAPHQTRDRHGFDWENLGHSISRVFGEENSSTRFENDLFEIISQFSVGEVNNLPHFYIDCGIEDGFIEVNRRLAEFLKEKEISFEYYENHGGHDWEYWDKQIKHVLPLVDRKLNLEAE